MTPRLNAFRTLALAATLASGPLAARGAGGLQAAIGPNIIPNGDLSQGNVGFTSDLPYVKPTFNCLWPCVYTVAPKFDEPQLHRLIAREAFPAPTKKTGKEGVLFANAGGTQPIIMWATTVNCKPNTRYLIGFNSISLTGHIVDGNPPYQVADPEWVPDFEISANDQVSPPFHAGQGVYYRGTMIWDSNDAKTVTVRIIRAKFPHGGAIVGISNIEMVPVKTGTSGRSR